MSTAASNDGPGAIQIIEEAVHLLREAPITVLTPWFIGVFPFLAGLALFWAEISRGRSADALLGWTSLVLAALYIWMGCWQSIFCGRLQALRAEAPFPVYGLKDYGRMIAEQSFWSATAFFTLPISMVLILPWAWTFAFHQNQKLVCAAKNVSPTPVRDSINYARLWPIQNHWLQFFLSAAGILLWLNWLAALYLIPWFLKIFFGFETLFTRTPMGMFNITFPAIAAILAYCSLDPLIKAVFVLRCFHGDARHNGEDLKIEIRRFSPTASLRSLIVLLSLITSMHLPAADTASKPVSAPATRSAQAAGLDKNIEIVLSRPEYDWRLQQDEPVAARKTSWLSQALDEVLNTIEKVWNWLGKLLDSIMKRSGNGSTENSHALDGSGISGLYYFLIASLCAIVAVLAVYLLRYWRRKSPQIASVTAATAPGVPDLENEAIGAEQLPESGWLALARDCVAQGDKRLALRAFYLAALAHLAERQWISLARFKSNRDYAHEVERRARTIPGLKEAFHHNVHLFDSAWYGLHDTTTEQFDLFCKNLELILAS